MSDAAKPSVLLSRGFPPEAIAPDFRAWFEDAPLRADDFGREPVAAPRPAVDSSGLLRARPSDSGHGFLPGAALFGESAGLAFGTEVHEALATIEWIPGVGKETKNGGSEVGEMLSGFLSHPEITPVFKRPTPQSEVWRERSVACRLEGTTYAAQMDRVVVTPATGKNGKGRILLVDFKTDQGEPEAIAGRYKAQIGIYARILALWSGGRHDIIGTVATVRKPALVRVC